MSDYRKEMSEVHAEAKWTMQKFFPMFLIVVAVIGVVGFGMRSMGLIGGTIVERKVFEQSYQRSEALKSEIAQQRATIMVLEQQLVSANAEESVLIQTQLNAARIRLATVEGEQRKHSLQQL